VFIEGGLSLSGELLPVLVSKLIMSISQIVLIVVIMGLVIERFWEQIAKCSTAALIQSQSILGQVQPLMANLMFALLDYLPLVLGLVVLAIALSATWKILKTVLEMLHYRWSVEATPPKSGRHVDISPGRIKSDVNGMYSEIFIGDKEYRLRLETNVTQLILNANQMKPAKEMSLASSRFEPLKQLPAGVVQLTIGDQVVGMGSRIQVGNKTYLATANHLRSRIVGEQTYMCSLEKRWKIQEVSFWSNAELDVLLIEIPSQVWSVMGVKALQVGIATPGTPVRLHGTANEQLAFSVGAILKTDNLLLLKHTASTLHGWSGTPLLAAGKVVAIHTGSDASTQNRNECTGIGQIVRLLAEANLESPTASVGGKEIQIDELKANDYEYYTYELDGIGSLYTGKSVFAVEREKETSFRMKPWHEMAEEDDYDFYSKESGFESVVQSSSQTSLNFKASEMQEPVHLKPCTPLAVTTSPKLMDQSLKACPSTLAEQVTSNSTVQKPRQTPKLLKKEEKSSQNLKNGGGQKWVQKQNTQVSSSKQLDSKLRTNQKASGKQSRKSSSYIPPHKRVEPVQNGQSKTSARK
jgi:hypothetical protein